MSGTTESGEPSRDESGEEPGLFDVDPKWFKIGFYLLLLVWMLYILLETLSYSRFEDVLFPFIIGIPILGLLVLQLFLIRYPWVVDRIKPEEALEVTDDERLQRRIEEVDSGPQRPKRLREKYELVMLGWIIVLPIMMFYLGLGWTLLLYVFGFTWYFVRDLRTAAAVTAVVSFFVLVLFIVVLDMFIIPGALGLPDPLLYVDELLDSLG